MTLEIAWDGGSVGPVDMFENAPDTFEIVVQSLPAGIPCDLHIQAFDAAEIVIYTGEARGVVFPETEILDVVINLTAADSGIDEGSGPHIDAVMRPAEDIPAGMIVDLIFVVSDPDDDELAYAIVTSGDGSFNEPTGTIRLENGSGTWQVRYTTPSEPGTAFVTLTVTDSAELEAIYPFSVTLVEPPSALEPGAAHVMSNFPPTVLAVRVLEAPATDWLLLQADALDDGGPGALRYDWEVNGHAYATGNPMTYPRNAGVIDVLLSVSDDKGAMTALAFEVDTAATELESIPLGNRPPVIESAVISHVEAGYGDTVTCAIYASDPDQDTLQADWTTDHGSIGATSVQQQGQTFVFRAEWHADVDPGLAHIHVAISDDELGSARYTFEVNQTTGRVGIHADAGEDREAFIDSTALLDGSGSFSDDGIIEDYHWVQISGPASTIVSPHSEQSEVRLTTIGTYVYKLTVANVNNTDDDTVVLSAVDPTVFSFSDANLDRNGVIYFLDLGFDRIRRYDAANRRFLPSFPMGLDPRAFSVAPQGDTIYVGYNGGAINTIDVASGERQYFASAAAGILCMVVADNYLFTIDASGSYDLTHSLYDRQTGARSDAQSGRSSNGVAYASSISTVFHLRDNTSPNDTYRRTIDQELGVLGPDEDSPYHSSSYAGHPIRVFPDDSRVAVRTGYVLDTSDLTHVGTLPYAYVDLAFHEDHIFLLRNVSGTAELARLDPNYQVLNVTHYPAEGLRIFVVQDELILILNTADPGLTFAHIELDPN